MTREDFEQLVEEALALIPQEFLDKLDNVALVIEDRADKDQRRQARLSGNQVLFGLYEGVPLIQRGAGYGSVLPDKITIFQKAIEANCATREEVRLMVRDTVWHEIAHHFGSDEHGARQAAKRTNK
ncbi:metallopeptidase family protein [Candidatus Falkowbacteria bacterium]|nr:metallopeptidase family protein [Candidatus Falkowbacteria bacterium]